MSKTDHVIETVLKYDGIFNFDDLYKTLVKWFKQRGFEFDETLYKQKTGSALGREVEIKWAGWVNVTEYIRYWIRIHMHGDGWNDVEILKNGKKKRMVKARLKITFTGDIELDYENRFERSSFLRKLREFHDKFLFKKELEFKYEDEIYYMVYSLQKIVKEFFDMESKITKY